MELHYQILRHLIKLLAIQIKAGVMQKIILEIGELVELEELAVLFNLLSS